MESHDEERIMHTSLTAGNTSNPDHNVRDLKTALRRIELNSAFFYTVPGPKMLWQFGELGYEVPINQNGRTGPKPIRWQYLDEPERRRLYDVTASLINLRNQYEVFHTAEFTLRVGGAGAQALPKSIQLNHPDMNVNVVGNFDVNPFEVIPYFQHTGTWYEYFSGAEIQVDDTQAPLLLSPSEYRLYTDVKLPPPPMGYIQTCTICQTIEEPNKLFLSPNPSAGETQIAFLLPEAANGKIEVFDYSGRLIHRLFDGPLPEGQSQFTFPLELPNGVYFVVLYAGNQTITEKLVISR
jgi:hypothetical protein